MSYIHCRNCPVYGAAGLALLDRPMPLNYRRERAEHYAREKPVVVSGARVSVVIFRLGREWLALPTSALVEVVAGEGAGARDQGSGPDPLHLSPGTRIHTLPHRRRGLALGLVNVRGELLICASAARLLGLEERQNEVGKIKNEETGHAVAGPSSSSIPHSAFARLLVASWNGQRVAFPVDAVHGIHRFAQAELQPPPATLARSAQAYTHGVFAWRERTVGQLDAERFFGALNRSLE